MQIYVDTLTNTYKYTIIFLNLYVATIKINQQNVIFIFFYNCSRSS